MPKNKSLLEYHLDQYEKGFVFQIVEQDDLVTNHVKRCGVFTAKNGWRVTIDRQPEIDVQNKVIYLRGRKSGKDDDMHRNQRVGSNKEVKKMIGAINQALQDLVSAAKGNRNKRPFAFYDTFVIDLREMDCFAPCCKNDNRIIIVK